MKNNIKASYYALHSIFTSENFLCQFFFSFFFFLQKFVLWLRSSDSRKVEQLFAKNKKTKFFFNSTFDCLSRVNLNCNSFLRRFTTFFTTSLTTMKRHFKGDLLGLNLGEFRPQIYIEHFSKHRFGLERSVTLNEGF
jgi:hypothetical protein